MIKICLKCKLEKDIENFAKDKNRKDGHFPYCKECCNKDGKNYYNEKKLEKIEYQKSYYQNHKKEKRLYDIQYKEKTKSKRNANEKILYENDMLYRFKKMARGCITKSFKRKGYNKNTNTYKILGCDYNTFMKHLLETYKKIYNENYDTSIKVHIDHIIPLSIAKTKDEVIKLCHFSNLQLLKATDNLKKSNKLNYNIGGELWQ